MQLTLGVCIVALVSSLHACMLVASYLPYRHENGIDPLI